MAFEIEIGGTKRYWKFNQEALEVFTRNINWEQTTSTSEIYAAFYGGLVAGCRVKQTATDFTFEQVCDWVDELNDDAIKQVMDAVAESGKYKQWLADFTEKVRLLVTDKDKKKVTKKPAKKR